MLKWNAFKLEYITLTRLFWAEQRTLSPPHPPPLISVLLLLCCLEKQGKHQTTAVNISTRISFVSRADHDQTKHQSGQCNGCHLHRCCNTKQGQRSNKTDQSGQCNGCHLHRRCNTKSEIRQNGPNRTMQWPSPPPVLQHKVKSEIRQNTKPDNAMAVTSTGATTQRPRKRHTSQRHDEGKDPASA